MIDNLPTKEQWQALYAATDKLKREKPWNYLWDMDLICLLLPGQEEPIFCSVMGMNGRCYGVGIYNGYEQLAGFYRVAEAAGLPYYISMSYQNCLTCYFGDREELGKQDLEPIRALGLKYRGKKQWPFFRTHESGFYPWHINKDEADLLILALDNLAIALDTLQREKLQIDFEGGETLIRQYDDKSKIWRTFVSPLPLIPMITGRLMIDDELLIARMKKHKKNYAEVELALFYLPIPAKDPAYHKPVYPRMGLLVDHQNGELLDQHMLKPKDEIPEVLIGMLLLYIHDLGIPKVIFVRDDITEAILNDLCEKLNIELRVSPNISAVEVMEENILNFIKNGR